MGTASAFLGLFLAAFTAATILPMQSEALLLMLLLKSDLWPWALIMVASIGNILGSCVNWWLGKYIEHFKDKKWFPVSANQLVTAQQHYHRYGRWSLLLSWVPFIGDPITVMAGVMKERFPIFLLFVSAAKIGRYVVIAVAAMLSS